MILGIVKGTVVATRKMPELVGYKFLLVEPVFGSKKRWFWSPPTRPPSMVWTIRRPLMLSSWASWTILPP